MNQSLTALVRAEPCVKMTSCRSLQEGQRAVSQRWCQLQKQHFKDTITQLDICAQCWTACTRLVQVQVRQNASGGHKIPSLTEKLLVKDRKGEIDLLKGVALVGLTHLADGPKPKHVQAALMRCGEF